MPRWNLKKLRNFLSRKEIDHLNLANTFLDIAESSPGGEVRKRNIANAWKAHDAVAHFATRVRLRNSEFSTIAKGPSAAQNEDRGTGITRSEFKVVASGRRPADVDRQHIEARVPGSGRCGSGSTGRRLRRSAAVRVNLIPSNISAERRSRHWIRIKSDSALFTIAILEIKGPLCAGGDLTGKPRSPQYP
jgi:hypothetical protein